MTNCGGISKLVKSVKAVKPNLWVWDYIVLIAEKIGTKWECKKGRKYGKGLFVGTEESEDNQGKEIEDFVENPTFDSSGSAQSIEEHGDSGPILIVNRTFFTPKGEHKDKCLWQNISKLLVQLGEKYVVWS